MTMAAENIGLHVGFNNLDTAIIDNATLGGCLIIVTIVTLLLVLAFAYILPLRIAVDPENPLKWYYPFVCGCCKREAGRQH